MIFSSKQKFCLTIFGAIIFIHMLLPAQHLELIDNRVTGVHNGNLIRTRFTNYGILGHRYEKPSMEWPKGSGIEYGLEFAMIAGARITDEAMTQYYIFTESYSDIYNIDEDPTGTYSYSWEPLPGYYNTLLPEGQQTIAMSNISESWPLHWIYDYPGVEGSRDGMWNGEFKAAPISDQESYYKMVDWNNTESAYYPFPEDSTKGGLGLEVRARTYQWSDPLAEDILISIYDITNTSQKILRNVVFGMYVDADVGGPMNDVMSFDPTGEINITYQWDTESSETGYFGFAFLESPGISDDGFDNDDDGLVDERRDNGRGTWIENDNSPYMMNRYGQPRSHWSGDEDGDWDVRYHDSGSDGLLPGEEDYPGPDTDGTEGNSVPDDGEPNFDRTDLDESDQIGLTSFSAATVNKYKLKDDQILYQRTTPGTFRDEFGPGHIVQPRSQINPYGNTEFIYGAGYFSLYPGQTERFSVATVFGNNEDDILGNKAIMQRIYEDNYRFAKPPIKPTLYAYAKDKQVILSWDSIAETSYDDIYGEDFEGYIIYKATDPEFNEIKTITDNRGNPFYYETLAQFDLKNGITGPHPVAAGANISGTIDEDGELIEKVIYYPGLGVHFNMGDDTGLQHYYIDNDVQNGRTYYYAIVAYDRGYDFDFYKKGWSDRDPRDGFKPIYPVQNSKTITQDVVGNIIFTDRNTAVVVPNAPTAGTDHAALDGTIEHDGPATGWLDVIILQPDSLKPGHEYSVTFTDIFPHRQTDTYQVWDNTDNKLLIERKYPGESAEGESILEREYETIESGIFNGIISSMINRVPEYKYNADWSNFTGILSNNPDSIIFDELEIYAKTVTNGNYHIISLSEEDYHDSFSTLEKPYPTTMEITFYDHTVGSTFSSTQEYRFPINFTVTDIHEGDQLRVLSVETLEHSTAYHNTTFVILKEINGRFYSICELTFFQKNFYFSDPFIFPAPGSILQINTTDINFTSRDNFKFKVKAAQHSENRAKNELDRIAVVPDPYIVSASWEKPLYFTSGRGERRIDFIHLPPKCTIRIFTLDGKLVRKLEHDDIIEDGHHSWDLTSKDGLDVAPGIYLFHVDAGKLGEKLGRFALIK